MSSLGEYFYDGDGKRVKKVVPSTGETTIFVYDAAGKLIGEYSTVVAAAEDARVAYLTADHLGSPRINTDRDGKVTSRHDYHPYGEEIITSQRTSHAEYTPDSVRKQFTGYERDGESGLDFAQARFHSFSLGRFTSPDPLMASAKRVNPQTFNRYSYVTNNPLNLVDPLGMDGCDPKTSFCSIASKVKNPCNNAGSPGCSPVNFGNVEVTAEPPETVPATAGAVAIPAGRPLIPLLEAAATTVTRAATTGAAAAATVGPAVTVGALILAFPTTANPTDCPVNICVAGTGPAIETGERTGAPAIPTTTTDQMPPPPGGPMFVRLGPGPETQENLAAQAAAAEANGFPYGVSVLLFTNPPPGSRAAPVSTVESAFEVRKTGKAPNHFTLVLPRPVRPDTASLFNQIFVPK